MALMIDKAVREALLARPNGTESLRERILRESIWDADIRERKDDFYNALKQLGIYSDQQGIPDWGLTFLEVEKEPDQLRRIDGFEYPLNCYVLKNVFGESIDKACDELLVRKEGNPGPKYDEDDISLEHLFSSLPFAIAGSGDFARFYRFHFYRSNFSAHELNHIREKTETVFNTFSYAVSVYAPQKFRFLRGLLMQLLAVRFKIAEQPFYEFRRGEGEVVGYYKEENIHN